MIAILIVLLIASNLYWWSEANKWKDLALDSIRVLNKVMDKFAPDWRKNLPEAMRTFNP